MQRACRQCGTTFTITDGDLAFLDRVSPVFGGKKESIPPPTLCSDCRLQRRLMYRTEIYVYQRPSSSTGETIFSMYPETVSFPVIPNNEWHSDRYDPLSFGQEFDPARPFFEQFAALQQRVPQPALASVRNENCDFCNNLSDNKNCYMVFNTSGAEDCMYCENAWDSRDCVECTHALQSELCYRCVACVRCYALQNSEYCEDCSDSFFLTFCRSCKHCFGCVNLRHREYCIFNEQKTKVEYEAFMRQFPHTSHRAREEARTLMEDMARTHPRPHVILRQVEGATGNFIQESKDVEDSYFIQHGEHIRRGFNLHEGVKDCLDYTLFGRRAELIYECATCGIDIQRLAFCYQCRDSSSDLFYCWHCDQCASCFGCVGLRHKRYCILNKQYTKEEHGQIVPSIIAHMQKTPLRSPAGSYEGRAREWGEFFPLHLAPHPYNRSQAHRYFPLPKEEVLRRGFSWYQKETEHVDDAMYAAVLPDGVPDTDNPIIVKSTFSGRPFKITSQEIKRYRKIGVPLPRLTYDERMEERARKLGGIRLYERTCAKTGKPIFTTYPPDSPYTIWDRDIYEREFGS